ncbi:adenylate kinase [Paragonimus westermani]|uniref:Adenylate kinase n=1 Tax=Paragonimus westermani TaxID=34504 RepID=A0A5J4NBT0_9TREM|nr:adenylate kinase [Paragonimus westermani]
MISFAMDVKKVTMTPTETKDYLAKNKIPQLFECLMTGLMYHRPADYVNYLQECLEKIKRQGLSGVRWDLFLETRPTSSPTVASNEAADLTSKYDPLPGVDFSKARIRSDASVICVLGGPGINRTSYSQGLISHYPNFVHLCMGDLLRNRTKMEAQREGSKWANLVEQINAGELLPHEIVVESLISSLNQHSQASGFIIDGFPRTQQQYEEMKNQVGLENLACVFLIDTAEDFCRKQLKERGTSDDLWKDQVLKAIDNRICLFKLQTLPMCKCIDADGKLRVVDGEIKPEHIARDMRTVCEYVLSGKITGPATRPVRGSIPDRPLVKVNQEMMGCPGQPPVFNIPRIVPTFVDKGRVADLHTCPVILLFGGPGSGRTEQAQALCERLPGLKHFSVTEFLRKRVLDHIEDDEQKDWDVVARRVHSSDPPMIKDVQVDILRQEFDSVAEDAKAVIIEGFPNDGNQLNTFNQHIGGADLAILLDCEESTLQKRLLKRYARLSRTEDEETVALHRIIFFKHCTLPVVRHYDERSILVTIPGDRDRELVLNDVVTVAEYFLGKQETQGNNSAVSTFGSRSNSVVLNELLKEQMLQKTRTLQPNRDLFSLSLTIKDIMRKAIFGESNRYKGVVIDDFPSTVDGELTVDDKLPFNHIVLAFSKASESQPTLENEDFEKQTRADIDFQREDSLELTQSTDSIPEGKQTLTSTNIHKVDASQTIEATFNDICSILENYALTKTPVEQH